MDVKRGYFKNLINREMAFMVCIMAYLAVLVINSDKLRNTSKAMPLALCVLCTILIIIKVMWLYFRGDVSEETSKTPVFQYPSLAFLVWLVIIGCSVYYVGYLVTIAVMLFVILKFFSKATTAQTICITAGTSLFLYVLFVCLLSVRFPKGILF
jgi:hypothetical protein